jgi:nicotinamidase-related amidase
LTLDAHRDSDSENQIEGGKAVTSATRNARSEPVSPENAVLLLVDQQEGLFGRIHEPQETRGNLLALARCAHLLGMPAILTTALSAGPNGPQLKELTEMFASQEIIDRTLINAWQDRRVHDAITHAGRDKVIIAGTGLDVCAQLPALASAAEGYDSYVVIDASGRFEPMPSVATISRLTQAGVALVNTRVIVLEAMADNAHPQAEEIYATLPAGLVIIDGAREQ